MKTKNQLLLALSLVVLLGNIVYSQNSLIKRTTYKNENISFGAGGTVTIVGAPQGSISIQGWNKNEVEISADIESQAENETDLAQLAQVNGFAIDESFGHIRIITVGTHDKQYMKKAAKKFPKRLLSVPFRIDYHIKVPLYCDLEIDGGQGDLNLEKVEGAMQIKFIQSNAKLVLSGGTISATIGSGTVDLKITSNSWRGRQAAFQLASGEFTAQLPKSFNAEIDVQVLRTGRIDNSITTLKQRDRTKFTDKSMLAKAGNGGAPIAFTVGDGSLKLINW